ncbi:hypothetical protein RchiOBHm_Chr1g0332171 [Rosa chinensis]|uniref:Uncharacterized protein n=1 Tax=Rosa chinensis TaxID=74649 RepID=A0A2P6SBQ5_ROSCH|nr:hypothetical protein RchiOBHm_Chr1g0332171 [Rosa chinensis]
MIYALKPIMIYRNGLHRNYDSMNQFSLGSWNCIISKTRNNNLFLQSWARVPNTFHVMMT